MSRHIFRVGVTRMLLVGAAVLLIELVLSQKGWAQG
jgi:hypothetical protein